MVRRYGLGIALACGALAYEGCSASGASATASTEPDAGFTGYDGGTYTPGDAALPPVPGTDLLAMKPGEDAKILLADGNALYALLVSSSPRCDARWMKIPTTAGAPPATTLWTGTLCQNRFLGADAGDTIFWAAALQQGTGSDNTSTGTTDLYALPKSGGAVKPFATSSSAVGSVSADANAFYWTVYGLGQDIAGNFECKNGGVYRAARSDMIARPVGADEWCPEDAKSDGTDVYWFAQQMLNKGYVLRRSAGGTAAPQSIDGFNAVTPPWAIASKTAYLTGATYDTGGPLFASSPIPPGAPVAIVAHAPGPASALPIVSTMQAAGGVLAWAENVYASRYRASAVALSADDAGVVTAGDASVVASDLSAGLVATDGHSIYVSYVSSDALGQPLNHLIAVPLAR